MCIFKRKFNKGQLEKRVFRVLCFILAGSNPTMTTDNWCRRVGEEDKSNQYHVEKIITKDGDVFGETFVFTDDIEKITSMFKDGIHSIEQIGHGFVL